VSISESLELVGVTRRKKKRKEENKEKEHHKYISRYVEMETGR